MSNTPAPTSSKQDWLPLLMLLVRATGYSLLSAVIAFLTVNYAFQINPWWLKFLVSSLLILIATGIGLTGMASFSVGVIRWAALGMNRPQLVLVESRLRETNHLLSLIHSQLSATDVSRRIVNRDTDHQILQKAIQQDIALQELDSAMALAKMLSQTYGRHEEAEEFRDQIQIARAEEMERKLATAIGKLDKILAKCEWDAAAREAAKIQRQFPDSPKVKQMDRRVNEARQAHKHHLEKQFLRAAERDDVDRAMEFLRELDKYLTEAEAGHFRETARGVIGKKRDNLGVQFKLAVHDKEWTVAVRVGEQLIREFPNSKMADEVRTMLDVLRDRATSQQSARR